MRMNQNWLLIFAMFFSVSAFAVPQNRAILPEKWEGGRAGSSMNRNGSPTVEWKHGESASIGYQEEQAMDLSSFRSVSFWMHSPKAVNSSFMFLFFSENDETKGIDYYSAKIHIDWTGWKEFIIPLRELSPNRQPIGWNKIDRILLTASGWGNTPNPETVLHLANFQFSKEIPERAYLTDEEFLRSLNLSDPALTSIREALKASDIQEAKKKFAAHIRNRKRPRWFFDWRTRPHQNVPLLPPEPDRAPGKWDYFSHFITIDWEGWKHFHLAKSDFESEAPVEGKGVQTKKPIGWNWIQYLRFNASGWNLIPDPEMILSFDDIQLIGKEKSVMLCDFESDPLTFEGLERSQERVKSGDFSGLWRKPSQTTSVGSRQIPHDWTEYDALDFWLYSEKATGGRIVLILDSDWPPSRKKADDFANKLFSFPFSNKDWSIQFEGKIDWTANPTKGENYTRCWNEALHRHFHFRDLSQAYWDTSDEKYAKALAEHWVDWLSSNPRPLFTARAPDGSESWQTLTVGMRIERVWWDALYRCLSSDAFTDDIVAAIFKSVVEQARHLKQWPSSGNWLTEESFGLYTAGMMFPEFSEAEAWRKIAIERLYRQLDEEVYPDGMEYELTSGYNNWVVASLTGLVERADMNGLRGELPKDYLSKLEKMYDYMMRVSMPNRTMPALNDSGWGNIRSAYTKGFEIFPHRQDMHWLATEGRLGQQPKETSTAFPYCGHYVMRSGWDKDALYLLLDSGLLGFGHYHEDKLHIILYAYGKMHILDSGSFSYDRSKWRKYVLGTQGHNTVMVDGRGQNRSRDLEHNRTWPKPWDTKVPPGNDTLWITNDTMDFARGVYAKGYGTDKITGVTHTRRILFVKPAYFLIEDTLEPADDQEHLYESLFHLNTESATMDSDSLIVRTENKEESNLYIVPLHEARLQAKIVKGQEDPVQGWSNDPWREVPTVIYSQKAKGKTRFINLLYPVPRRDDPAEGERVVIPKLRKADSDRGSCVEVVFPDGKIDRITFRDLPGCAEETAPELRRVEQVRKFHQP